MKDTAELFVDSRSELGEGPFWHPELRRLFWFDILNCTLLSADAHGRIVDRFTFKEPVSAASVIDRQTLAVVSGSALLRFDMASDSSTEIAPIEPDKPTNRSNDSRVNFAGGFWIGTMDRKESGPTGALYQYRAGHLETVLEPVSIPNSICFSPDGRTAYFSDTGTRKIMKCRIDPGTGLPTGAWTLFADIGGHRGSPDGSVVDSEGYLWNARYNGSCVVRHAPDGSIDRIVELPVSQVTCPAFGGDDLKTLYITSARQNLTPEQLEKEPTAGSVYNIRIDVPGLPEPKLKL
jgi:sugar lactone lactonase YvrE